MLVTPFDFVYFAGAFIATLVCLVVVLYRDNRSSNVFLALGLFSLGYILLSFFSARNPVAAPGPAPVPDGESRQFFVLARVLPVRAAIGRPRPARLARRRPPAAFSAAGQPG